MTASQIGVRAHDRPGEGYPAAELRALLATVRDESDGLEDALRQELRWPLLVLLSEKEQATTVLHRRLVEAGSQHPDALPSPEEMRALANLAAAHELRLIQLQRRLDALLEALAEEGIEVLLLKGAALLRTVYSSVGERPMADVDLLVKPDRARQAWEVAIGQGWERPSGPPPNEAYRVHHHLPPLTDGAGLGLGLELHTAIFPPEAPFRISAEAFWRSARRSPGGELGLVPSVDHLLLHCALHFTWSHCFGFGIWKTFRDVDRLMANGAIDHDGFVRLAVESKGRTGAFWTLRLARAWAGVPVEEALLQELRPGSALPFESALARHFARRLPGGDPRCPVALDRLLWEMAMRPRSEGHGAARPWGEAMRWEDESDEGAAATSPLARGIASARYLLEIATARN